LTVASTSIPIAARMYRLLKPLLFRLDAEQAHQITLMLLDSAARIGLPTARRTQAVGVRVMGLEFPNAVGLAAGLDKNGAHIDALARLGFGFIEVGTVTPRPQPGNPRPRMFRIPQARAVINRMGFNNLGVDRLVRNVRAARYRGVLGINIGKNSDTPIERAAADYVACMRKAYPVASYLTVNISSPNTRNLRQLQQADELERLLAELKAEQQRLADAHGRYVPLALKIAPDLDGEAVRSVAQLLLAHHVDGVIATNTTLSRDGVEGLPHCQEAGGLSGAPLAARATEVARLLAQHLQGRIPIIGVGGIMSGEDAVAKLDAGASLVQLYTGLVYAGPGLIYDCVSSIGQAGRPLAAIEAQAARI
jgi:dihydroorotate dehydrogenase